AVHQLAHLPGSQQQSDIRAAVTDDSQVGELRPADRPNQRHGLAPRPPAPDADCHPRAQIRHYGRGRHQLLPHGRPPPRGRKRQPGLYPAACGIGSKRLFDTVRSLYSAVAPPPSARRNRESLARGLVVAMSRESADRHDQILVAAAQLFARKGVAATTVREIADEVGIWSGSLYHHFDSKEAMVDEILAPYLKDLGDACQRAIARPADPRAKLRDLIAACLCVVEAHPHATEIYQSDVNY